MIIIPCKQRSDEWQRARLGIPTASNFSQIITANGERSRSVQAYRNELLAEFLTGQATPAYTNEWIERGVLLEEQARDYYELLTDRVIQQVGFVYKDECRLCGCSPDGLLDDRGLEIKVLKPGNHVEHLLGTSSLPFKYKPQVQGNMYVTDKDTWDWLSYHPDMPPVLVTVRRDKKFIEALEDILTDFLEDLLAQREILTSRGIGTKAALEASLGLLK